MVKRTSIITKTRVCFYSAVLNTHRSGVLTALAWLVPHETAAVSALVLCTPYNRAPCHFMQSNIRKVHGYLAVTCHLHFWQHDLGLLCATAAPLVYWYVAVFSSYHLGRSNSNFIHHACGHGHIPQRHSLL